MKPKAILIVITLCFTTFWVSAQNYSHLVYAISDAGNPRGFSHLDLDDATNYEVLYEQSGVNTEWRSSTWMNGEWWAILYFGDLYKVNIETGEPTHVATISQGTHSLMGMTYDPVSGNLYVNDVENLYILNPSTGAKTLVGALGAPFGVGGMFGLSCDHLGNLYGLNTIDDNLYSINTTTGGATVIGSLNNDTHFFISLMYDQDAQQMYAAGLGGPFADVYGVYEVNLTTGEMTLYQEFVDPIAYRANSIAIPYDTLGVSENHAINTIVFPNPVATTLNISDTEDISAVEIYNLLGQRVLEISEIKNQLDISNLKQGVYLLKLVSNNNPIKTIRFIKN